MITILIADFHQPRAKLGDHRFMFGWIETMEAQTRKQQEADGVRHEFRYYHNVSLVVDQTWVFGYNPEMTCYEKN